MAATSEDLVSLLAHDRRESSRFKELFTTLVKYGKPVGTAGNILAQTALGASAQAAFWTMYNTHYKKPGPGLWLAGPVAGGAVVNLTHATVEYLTQKFPDNKYLKAVKKVTFIAEHGVNGLFADVGFIWSMLAIAGVYIDGVEFAQKYYANMWMLPVSTLAGAIIRTVNYHKASNKLVERSLFRHLAATLEGASIPAGLLYVLLEQMVIELDSPLPVVMMVMTAIIGLFASLSLEGMPVVSKGFSSILALGGSASLAAGFFHIPLDIMAALSATHTIADGPFYTTVGVASILFSLMFINSMAQVFQKTQANELEELENGDEEAPDYSSDASESEDDEDNEANDESASDESWENPRQVQGPGRAGFFYNGSINDNTSAVPTITAEL